jgi:uncharacterized protein YcgL (UPF0745 family)
MQLCHVLRSGKKEDTYLYLSVDKPFEELPEPLRMRFGEPVRVMSLKLTRDSRLAHADVTRVMEALEADGFYLQLPPKLSIEDEITRRFSPGGTA